MNKILYTLLALIFFIPISAKAQKEASATTKNIFPKAKQEHAVPNTWTEILGKRNKIIGYIAYSKPASNGIEGYAGETPLMIAFDENHRIIAVKMLRNNETPSFVNRVTQAGLLNSWNGLNISEAQQKKVDAVSGATYTSTGVINSLHACLKNLNKNLNKK